MSKIPWIRRRKKTEPEIVEKPPIRLGNFSNGEYFHEQTPHERKIEKEILRQADDKARKLGMDRRDFLASAMGMATSLSVLNLAACSSSESGGTPAKNGAGGKGNGTGTDGGYVIPPDATMNEDAARHLVGGNEFIFDIQSHHIEDQGSWRTTNLAYGQTLANFFAPFNGCTEQDTLLCIDANAYLQEMFLHSDTTIAVLSGFPSALCTDGVTTGCGNPLDNDAMAKSAERFNRMAQSQRVVNHCQVNPTDHLDLQLAIMENVKNTYGCYGFKTYPEWGPTGKGWYMDDPASGIPFIEKAQSLGVNVLCMHKGIVFPGWDPAASDPRDVGVVAKAYPDMKFIVYHSAIEFGPTDADEGPYDPTNTKGTDRLIRAVLENNLAGKNVYAELGSVWAQVMNSPTMAQHVIGKLVKNLGPDNVLWGSECIWLGSPQQQIEAFRAFQISQEFRDKYGYPELTPDIKAKIFGLSSAAVYGIDPNAKRYEITQTALAQAKNVMDGELGDRRWAFQEMGGPRTRREFLNLARRTGGRPG